MLGEWHCFARRHAHMRSCGRLWTTSYRYRTGLNAIKNVAPYNGITLNFCAITLDGGPIRTSTICFDNSGLDPQHPYVIVKVETAGPQYNIFQVLFGISVHDAAALPTPQDFTISFTCQFV
ncbi:hypothetical protein WJX81_007720 [Elliptochloris bilobata]|uniref:Uncharacterized protein n=1 Tax=Elliptochloris bilobata TaxID=381761 RepID=A0AAW1QIJ4_9CHLO